MSTLFQLHSDLSNLSRNLATISNYWQSDDGILLMGQTVAFIDWVHDYYCQQPQEQPQDDEQQYKQQGKHEKQSSCPKTFPKINFYALQADFEVLTKHTQASIQQTDFVKFVHDDEWVSLTNQYDNIMTIN